MREEKEREVEGGDGNCFRQRQWGAIRVIKLISRTNKGRERERERGREREKERGIDLMMINGSRSDTGRKQWNQLFLFSPSGGGKKHTRATAELKWMELKLLLSYLELIYPLCECVCVCVCVCVCARVCVCVCCITCITFFFVCLHLSESKQ